MDPYAPEAQGLNAAPATPERPTASIARLLPASLRCLGGQLPWWFISVWFNVLSLSLLAFLTWNIPATPTPDDFTIAATMNTTPPRLPTSCKAIASVRVLLSGIQATAFWNCGIWIGWL